MKALLIALSLICFIAFNVQAQAEKKPGSKVQLMERLPSSLSDVEDSSFFHSLLRRRYLYGRRSNGCCCLINSTNYYHIFSLQKYIGNTFMVIANDNEISIRGASPDDIQYYIDGYRIMKP